MRFLRRSLTGLFLLALTAGLLVYAVALVQGAVQTRLADEPSVPEARERVFTVNTVIAAPGREVPVLTAFGQIESRRELELRAAVQGRIVELADAFEEGGRVTEGQLLVRIDPAEADAALRRAQSDLLDARAEAREAARAIELAEDNLAAAREQVDLYERAFQRQQDLADRGVGATSAVEAAELQASTARAAVIQRRQALADAEARADQAETSVSRAEIDVSEAERDLEDTEIRAGFDGVLSEVSVVEGRRVSANEQLARLIDPDALEVAFPISTQAYARLLEDGTLDPAPVTVTLDVYGTDLVARGRLDRAAAQAGAGQTGRVLYARLDAAPGFQPGDFVEVALEEAALTDVVRLPATALSANGAVLAVGAEERLDALSVTLLRRQGDDILVRGADGVDLDGAEIVVQRTPLLGPGIKVRPLGPPGDVASGAETAEAEELMELTEERRARLKAYVQDSAGMPEAAKERILAQLDAPQVPTQVVTRLEARIGG